MLQERIEPDWLEAFQTVLAQCGVTAGTTVAVLCESQSRPVLVELARLAAARLHAQAYLVQLNSPNAPPGLPVIRSTGASQALAGLAPVVGALAASELVVDCTVEGLMHAPELPQILKGGARVIYVSNEHPETLCRLLPNQTVEQSVKEHIKRLRGARHMRVTSPFGTDLNIDLQGAVVGGNWGVTHRPGTLTHWPGGLVLAFPRAGSVQGNLVLAEGDVNLTFKRYLEQAVTLRINDDHIDAIEGQGLDAELMRSYMSAWGDRAAYAVSHVGYGLNPAARWDSMAMLDKRDFNGTELRAFAGNFLYSTGANEVAGRHTLGHFDLPMRHCTVYLDEQVVVRDGQLV